MHEILEKLRNPSVLHPRGEVVGRRSLVPPEPGIYAWYFERAPSDEIEIKDCWHRNGMYLLYVGISPKKPPKSGKPSSGNVRKRINDHMNSNASGSTLRLSLGCLLSRQLGIELRRVGRTERFTFSSGEGVLSEWLNSYAWVTWQPHPEPWVLEDRALSDFYLPLNLDKNESHPFYPVLRDVREAARSRARQLPVIAK